MLEGDISSTVINSILQPINARLASLDYEIRSSKDQLTKNITYALVNTTSDLPTQLATTFNADEIAYVKRILDAMFETNNTRNREILAVTTMQASDLSRAPRRARQSQINGNDEDSSTQAQPESSVKGLTLHEGEAVLAQLVHQQFFTKSRSGYFSLAPRGLMELRNFLKDTYNEPANPEDPEDEPVIRVRDCEGCREIVTVGVRCDNRDCGVRFHDSCAAQFFRSQRGGVRKCSGCETEWTGELFVGERAAVAAAGRRSTGGGRVSGARGTQVFGDEEEEEDEDE